jgi:hypothetical protein
MKRQSYQHIPYFENTVCERCSRRLGYLLSAPATARLGFAHGPIHDAR